VRRAGLELLKGGGEAVEPECHVCLAGMGDQLDPAEVGELLASLPGRMHVCAEHKEGLERLGVSFSPVVEDAAAQGRRARRAGSAAFMRAANRAARNRRVREARKAPRGEPGGPSGTGGITF
jgi:hypothetical protein